MPGGVGGVHRGDDPLAVVVRHAAASHRGRASRPLPLHHLDDAGVLGGEADVIADVKRAAGQKMLTGQVGE